LSFFTNKLNQQELDTSQTGIFLGADNSSTNPSNLHGGLRSTNGADARYAFAELLNVFGVANG
jgi:hypothetical protein